MSAHNTVKIGERFFDEATAAEITSLATAARCSRTDIVAGIEALASPARLFAKASGISESKAESIINVIKAADARSKKAKPAPAPSQAKQAETSRQAAAIMARRQAERAAAASPAPRSIARHTSPPTAASKSALVRDILAKQSRHARK